MKKIDLPEGFMIPITEDRAQEMFIDLLDYAESLGFSFPYKVQKELIFSSREGASGACEDIHNMTLIWISPLGILRYGEGFTREILIHEIAHAISPIIGHGKEWRAIGNKIGSKWNIKMRPGHYFTEYLIQYQTSRGMMSHF